MMSNDLGKQFTDAIRYYCNDEGIDVIDWSSTFEHYVIIAGDITLNQIGRLYEYFRDEGVYKLKIEYMSGLEDIGALIRHCFKITKELCE